VFEGLIIFIQKACKLYWKEKGASSDKIAWINIMRIYRKHKERAKKIKGMNAIVIIFLIINR